MFSQQLLNLPLKFRRCEFNFEKAPLLGANCYIFGGVNVSGFLRIFGVQNDQLGLESSGRCKNLARNPRKKRMGKLGCYNLKGARKSK